MIRVTTSGSFKNFADFAGRIKQKTYLQILRKYGPVGVNALAAATPRDSGETATSWYYYFVERPGYFSIQWANSHMEHGVSIAAIIQYGHGTKQGAYVEGVDYINPAMRPIFEQIAADMWREVTK